VDLVVKLPLERSNASFPAELQTPLEHSAGMSDFYRTLELAGDIAIYFCYMTNVEANS
jgi:hypothetical protein